MQYISTRGGMQPLPYCETLLEGLAPDGGLAVPDERVDLFEEDALFGAVVVEEAQLDLLGGFAEQGEVGALTVEGRAERIGGAGPDVVAH